MSDLFMILATDTASICEQIPDQITAITQTLYTVIKIVIPVILIVYGMIDFGKSVMAGKEDEIKANQKLFVKRLIAAALVFFILSIVQLVLGIIDVDSGIMDCVKSILGA